MGRPGAYLALIPSSGICRATEAASEFSSLRASAEEAQRLFESKEAACEFTLQFLPRLRASLCPCLPVLPLN
jgi:hypothetical protein